MRFFGVYMELYWSCTGIKTYSWVGCAWGRSPSLWLLSAEGWSRSEAGAERGWSFWAWLVALDKREGRGQAQKPSHREGEGSDGMTGVCFFGSVCWIRGRAEVKETSPDIEGQPETKIPKIPKIPIVVDLLGS